MKRSELTEGFIEIMDIEEIFKDVALAIESSIGTPADTISMDDTLFEKLGVDSIDLVDILFELETKYDVELKVSDLEAKAKIELGDVPYEIDGIITKEGLEAIEKHMPEIDAAKIQSGITVHQLVQLFTVHSLCKIIQYRLENKDESFNE